MSPSCVVNVSVETILPVLRANVPVVITLEVGPEVVSVVGVVDWTVLSVSSVVPTSVEMDDTDSCVVSYELVTSTPVTVDTISFVVPISVVSGTTVISLLVV